MYVVESKIGPSEDCDASHPDQSGVESGAGQIWSLYETSYCGGSPFCNFETFENMELSLFFSSLFFLLLFLLLSFSFFSLPLFFERAPCLLLQGILWDMTRVFI